MRDLFPPPEVALDQLLAGICRGLVSAQRQLDRSAVVTPRVEGELPSPWFLFRHTTVELELSTFVVDARGSTPSLVCKPLDPVAVAIRGHGAASGTRIRIDIEPLGAALLDKA